MGVCRDITDTNVVSTVHTGTDATQVVLKTARSVRLISIVLNVTLVTLDQPVVTVVRKVAHSIGVERRMDGA